MLSRFVCVHLGYIAQGVSAGALVGCYEPTAQVLLFPPTQASAGKLGVSPGVKRTGGLIVILQLFTLENPLQKALFKLVNETPPQKIPAQFPVEEWPNNRWWAGGTLWQRGAGKGCVMPQ